MGAFLCLRDAGGHSPGVSRVGVCYPIRVWYGRANSPVIPSFLIEARYALVAYGVYDRGASPRWMFQIYPPTHTLT